MIVHCKSPTWIKTRGRMQIFASDVRLFEHLVKLSTLLVTLQMLLLVLGNGKEHVLHNRLVSMFKTRITTAEITRIGPVI